MSVTHEKHGVFIRLKDIQQIHIGATVYEDKIAELDKGEGRGELVHRGGHLLSAPGLSPAGARPA